MLRTRTRIRLRTRTWTRIRLRTRLTATTNGTIAKTPTVVTLTTMSKTHTTISKTPIIPTYLRLMCAAWNAKCQYIAKILLLIVATWLVATIVAQVSNTAMLSGGMKLASTSTVIAAITGPCTTVKLKAAINLKMIVFTMIVWPHTVAIAGLRSVMSKTTASLTHALDGSSKNSINIGLPLTALSTTKKRTTDSSTLYSRTLARYSCTMMIQLRQSWTLGLATRKKKFILRTSSALWLMIPRTCLTNSVLMLT